MKIYVASSWRNEARQQQMVVMLRDEGHEVYDFRHPAPGNDGFGWKQVIELGPEGWTPQTLRKALDHPNARAGFKLDMDALMGCDACVLVLPCGRSAHLELGYATGAGKLTVVLAESIEEPELMYLMCDHFATHPEAVLDILKEPVPS